MKKIEFTHIFFENFGKHRKPIQAQLGQRVLISGQNMTGKSTIKRAIQYVLGSRDENGKEITGIRPHDENGVDIDGLTTTAELTVSVDGQENTIKRICFQEKNRQGEYTGKDNLQYFVDDVRKGTKKAYEEFVSSFLPSMVCISAQEFLSKDTAGRREMLEIFNEHDNDSIIDENAEFEPIRAKLKANKTAELKKAYRDRIKEETKKRDEKVVEIRVEEQHKKENIEKLNGLTLEQIEKNKKDIEDKITENKAKQEDVSKRFAEFDKLADGIMELQFELSDLQRKANEENNRKRLKIEDEIYSKKFLVSKTENTIKTFEEEVSSCKESIECQEKFLEEFRQQYTQVQSLEFDENSFICSMCGQEYPADKKEQLRADFEDKKRKKLAIITEQGTHEKEKVAMENRNLDRFKNELSEHKKSLEMLNIAIADLEQQLSALPNGIDISDREDVKAIKQKIAEREAAMQKGNSAEGIKQQLKEECEDMQSQLNEVEKQIALAQRDVEIDERVEQLRKEQLELSQKIADVERELDLLKSFERKKAELLETDVNANFEFVQFRMFEPQVNGDLKDVCLITVDGESYDRNLNFSNRLLAEVDICRGFQKKFDVQLPILLDNAESIDKDRLPDIPNQLILFQRTDDKELRIEVV